MRSFMYFQIISLVILDLLLFGHWAIYHDLSNLIIYFLLACAFLGLTQVISAMIIITDKAFRTYTLKAYIIISFYLIGTLVYLIANRFESKDWFFYMMSLCYFIAHIYPSVLFGIIRKTAG